VKIYLKDNVFDKSLERMRWVFDEFPNVVVGVSGGKDSTVVFNLAMIVAREKGRLPLKCLFLDQEAEWEATIDTIRLIMEHPDVDPYWLQMPLQLFNATSTIDHWLMCWDEKEEARWMCPRESYSIKENVYGTMRFVELFTAVLQKEFPDTKTCYIAGVRAQESPTRAMGMTNDLTYKDATWGKALDKSLEHYTLYPIYDWSYMDVWKAIHDNQWYYNKIYDAQYSYGVGLRNMRVSNVHHEIAVGALFYMQELEPETYQRLTQRIAGIDMAGKMGDDDYFPKELPFMFASWREYRDYLLDKLIEKPDWNAIFKKRFIKHDEVYGDELGDVLFKVHIKAILTNDWELVRIENFERYPKHITLKRRRKAEKDARDTAQV
jgi:predicted phosphoadenosine phosphosulfate sulfurtransferase